MLGVGPLDPPIRKLHKMEQTELINPLRKIRIRDYNKSPEQLAKDAGIQLAAIGQAEEGFYPNPLPSYLLALGIKPGSQEEFDLTNEYHEYQTQKRISNGPNHSPKLILSPIFDLDTHPLISWRTQSGLATYGFCSAYCIHMPSVNFFEKNILKCSKIPPSTIEGPLLEAGYDLTEFTEACNLYKSNLINESYRRNNLTIPSN